MMTIMIVISVHLYSGKIRVQEFKFKDKAACVKALKRVKAVSYRIIKKECHERLR